MKAIIFDLYNTILDDDDDFDFNGGLEYLHEHYFSEECSVDDFVTFSLSFIPKYQDRAITNKEVSFIRDEYSVYCEQLEYTPDISIEDIDYEIMEVMQKECLTPQTKQLLNQLKEKGIKMYILTNSIFMASSHKRLLSEFNIMNYFEDLYSSSDFGMRKPDASFFEYAVQNILNSNPQLTKEDIVVVGDNYYDDIQGALNAGITPIWYNKDNLEDECNLKVNTITSLSELINFC